MAQLRVLASGYGLEHSQFHTKRKGQKTELIELVCVVTFQALLTYHCILIRTPHESDDRGLSKYSYRPPPNSTLREPRTLQPKFELRRELRLKTCGTSPESKTKIGLVHCLRAIDSGFIILPKFPDKVIDHCPETPWKMATKVATIFNTIDARDDPTLDLNFAFFPERNDQVKVPEVFEFTQFLPLSDNPRLFLIMDIVPTLGVIIINVNGSDGLGLDVDSWDTFAGTYVHLSICVAYHDTSPPPSVRITRSQVRSIL